MLNRFGAIIRNSVPKLKKAFSQTRIEMSEKVTSIAEIHSTDDGLIKSPTSDLRNFQALQSSLITWQKSKYAQLSDSIFNLSGIYDSITGRQSVRQAAVDLHEAEVKFTESQMFRREQQQKLFDVQKKRVEVSNQVNVISRGDPAFIPLVTKEHELAAEENTLLAAHLEADRIERANYEKFTSLMRYLHAEEKNYDMRMRQWALIGSISLSFISAFITWLRFSSPPIVPKDFKQAMNKIVSLELIMANIDQTLQSLQLEFKRSNNSAVVTPPLTTPVPPPLFEQLSGWLDEVNLRGNRGLFVLVTIGLVVTLITCSR